MIELDLQVASEGQAPSLEQLQQWCALALRQRSADSELTIRLVDEPEGRELNTPGGTKITPPTCCRSRRTCQTGYWTFRCSATW